MTMSSDQPMPEPEPGPADASPPVPGRADVPPPAPAAVDAVPLPAPRPVDARPPAPVPHDRDRAPADGLAHDPAETAFLRLLAAGAAAEDYERPVLRARADGASAGRLAALERAKLLALRVRAELEGRRRREAELSALYATAHDLAGLRDLDAVLRAIVRRARSLLGTEVAYLTLNDPAAGDTYMRVTDGSVSARFQQLRLGMGEGLGGLVAQTARPYVTDNYFHDERFRHTRTIDSGVHDEGLVAILGVPLMLGSGVIGVLFAADRRERVFEHGEIALLAAHAAHAAVAIDTARLLAETRKTLTELEAANEIIRDRSSVIERASDIHDRLTELVLRGGGVADVAQALAEVLHGDVEFTDPGRAPAAALDRSRADGHAVREGADWVAAVGAGGEVLGALVLRGHPALDPVDQRTLERAAMVTSLLLLARRTAGEAEQRVRGELLDDLLNAADRDPRLLGERAARVGADLDAPHIVLAARTDEVPPAHGAPEADGEAASHPDGADRRRLWSAASHLAATRRGLAAVRDGGAVLLLPLGPDGDPAHTAREIAARLGAALHQPVTVGASAPVPAPAVRPAAVVDAYAEARRCREALRVLGRAGQGAAAADFGFLGLLLADTRDVDGFVHRTLGPVADYDARRGTELLRTLGAYFACGMSPARTKDSLHVHVNTVAQRLERVSRLLGPDWQTPARALEIQLALRLHQLSSAVARDTGR
ncbi:cyclic diguanylate phosphodiesterase [Streptomyces caniferus]|uniref:Cyclic diguanylate phosphodiesterase n=2 Tax=Streptomyces caniferus TaxID=285557 RepID=A0A640SDF2_9ACTN|nr:cyclic diguanylate phosphodiesterase [Streptomyces caniferus]